MRRRVVGVLCVLALLALVSGAAFAATSYSPTVYKSCAFLCCKLSGYCYISVGSWEPAHNHYHVSARAETSLIAVARCDTYTTYATCYVYKGTSLYDSQSSGGALGQGLAVATWSGTSTDRAATWSAGGYHRVVVYNHARSGYDVQFYTSSASGSVPAP